MNQHAPLSASVRLVAELRERLKDIYALADGDEVLETTLEGESDLGEQLAILAREALRSEAMAEGMKALIKTNQERKARLEYKAEKLRGVISWAMQDSGSKKIRMDDMTLSLSEGRAPVVIDETITIPDVYCRITKEPNKTLIRTHLEESRDIPFAKLGNPAPSLTIRSK